MRDIEGLLTEEVNKLKNVTTHIRVPVTTKEILKKRAQKRDQSLVQYIKELVDEDQNNQHSK